MHTGKATLTVVILVLLAAIFLCSEGTAHALEMEYYTYNGFDPIVSAFQKIALIFGDNGYKALFFSVIAMSIFFGGFSFYYKLLSGGKGGGLSWTIPVATGVVLWAGLILPRGTLHIYDTVLNRYQAVGNIPDGIVALAGGLNLIERGIVDIIHTSGDPRGYQQGAGGIGFNILLKATTAELKLKDQYVDESLKKYTIDCLFFELQRPGTSLSINDITSLSTDFFTQYEQAKNPAVYTVWYEESQKTGVTMTCENAWGMLSNYFNDPANLADARKAACAYAGFNPNNANELSQCNQVIENYIGYTSGGAISITAAQYIRQAYMAQNLNNTLLSVNPDLAMTALANRNTVTGNLGAGIMANEWLPIARAIVTAVAIGLIPFLVLFIPTPLFGKAIGTIAGFFVWLTAWGITDAVTHGLAMDNAYKIFEHVRNNHLGFAALMSTPDTAMKTLSMFGMVRTFGIMLATVLSGMLVKFGGHALAMMAGSISGQLQSQGSSAAMAAQTPEGSASTLNSLAQSMPTHAWANKYSWSERTSALTAEKLGHQQGMSDLINQFGVGGTTRMMADGTISKAVGFGASGAAMREAGLNNAHLTKKHGAAMDLTETGGRYNGIGGRQGLKKLEDAASYNAAVNVGSVAHKKELGMSPQEEAQAGAHQQFMKAATYGNLDKDTMISHAKFDEWKIRSGAEFVKEMKGNGLSDHDVYTMWAANETLKYYDAVGKVNALDGDASRQAQLSFARTSAEMERVKADEMMAGELGLNSLADYYAFRGGGSALGKEQAEFLRAKGWDVEEGMVIRAGLNAGTGRLEYLTGEKQGRSYSSVLKDGMRIERGGASDRIGGHTFSGLYEKAYTTEGTLLYGRYSGLVDGKEGHLTMDGLGRVAYAEGRGGWDFESRRIDRTTVDSSTTINQGTHVGGEPGVFVLDPKKFTATSMIEKGDDRYAQWLTDGNKATKSANTTVFAAGWSQEVGAFISRTGAKFDAADASATVKAGFEALGIGTSMLGSVKTGSRDETQFNILSSGMNMVVTHARETAMSRGLTEAEAIKRDVDVFHSKVMNEGLRTKPLFGENKHMPVTDTKAQFVQQQVQNEPPHHKGIPMNPMTTRK